MSDEARQSVEELSFGQERKDYIVNTLDPILVNLVQELFMKMPGDPVNCMIAWLREHDQSGIPRQEVLTVSEKNAMLKKELASMKGFVAEVGELAKPAAEEKKAAAKEDASSEEEDDDEGEDMPPPPPPGAMKARQSVSAEAYGLWNQKKEFTAPEYAKSAEQSERIRSILSNSFMFKSLQKKDMDVILLAVKECVFEPGQRIIQEGEDGECLFIIEEGNPECKKVIDGEDKVVKKCTPGDVFGELALLYNAKRAASVDAADRCVAWQLDRETFNHIVKEAASARSGRYEGFLKKVKLLEALDDYARSQLSDALKQEEHKKGDLIVKQGEEGDKFYIVEEGKLAARKDDAAVMEYQTGDYFGELSLLKNQPRAATIEVTSDTASVLSLDRRSFTAMLGSLQEMLDQADKYK
eukprot:TRINITY_DN48103_c0_g1_i1.p1 TRINITY_DN48103_c0_g1~~TRINITY_DN48103_c0_g1_i1.p1  ORF type:complete len:411 (+),score=161.31 TRINITY_DN48103_c0_g1_i1:63-1295(+)